MDIMRIMVTVVHSIERAHPTRTAPFPSSNFLPIWHILTDIIYN